MHVPNEMERVLEDTIDLNGFQLTSTITSTSTAKLEYEKSEFGPESIPDEPVETNATVNKHRSR